MPKGAVAVAALVVCACSFAMPARATNSSIFWNKCPNLCESTNFVGLRSSIGNPDDGQRDVGKGGNDAALTSVQATNGLFGDDQNMIQQGVVNTKGGQCRPARHLYERPYKLLLLLCREGDA
jgi:hypothetical protein